MIWHVFRTGAGFRSRVSLSQYTGDSDDAVVWSRHRLIYYIMIPVPDSWWICWILEPPFPIMAPAKSFGMLTSVVVVCWFPNIISCPPIAPIMSLLKPPIPLPQHAQLTVERTASTLWCLHQFALKFPDLESCTTNDATSLALVDQHTNYSLLYSTLVNKHCGLSIILDCTEPTRFINKV